MEGWSGGRRRAGGLVGKWKGQKGEPDGTEGGGAEERSRLAGNFPAARKEGEDTVGLDAEPRMAISAVALRCSESRMTSASDSPCTHSTGESSSH